MRLLLLLLVGLLVAPGCASTAHTSAGDTRTYADNYPVVRQAVYDALAALGMGVEEVQQEGNGEYIIAIEQKNVASRGNSVRQVSRLQVHLFPQEGGRVEVRLVIPAAREYGGRVNLQRYRQDFFTDLERRGLTQV